MFACLRVESRWKFVMLVMGEGILPYRNSTPLLMFGCGEAVYVQASDISNMISLNFALKAIKYLMHFHEMLYCHILDVTSPISRCVV